MNYQLFARAHSYLKGLMRDLFTQHYSSPALLPMARQPMVGRGPHILPVAVRLRIRSAVARYYNSTTLNIVLLVSLSRALSHTLISLSLSHTLLVAHLGL